jgi:hypothetical protein
MTRKAVPARDEASGDELIQWGRVGDDAESLALLMLADTTACEAIFERWLFEGCWYAVMAAVSPI